VGFQLGYNVLLQGYGHQLNYCANGSNGMGVPVINGNVGAYGRDTPGPIMANGLPNMIDNGGQEFVSYTPATNAPFLSGGFNLRPVTTGQLVGTGLSATGMPKMNIDGHTRTNPPNVGAY
jgi:hypothetical protein